MRTLLAERIAQWKYDGFLSPFPLLDEEELQACRQGVERYETWLGSPINADAAMKWRSMVYLLMNGGGSGGGERGRQSLRRFAREVMPAFVT